LAAVSDRLSGVFWEATKATRSTTMQNLRLFRKFRRDRLPTILAAPRLGATPVSKIGPARARLVNECIVNSLSAAIVAVIALM
jgi:hypothetical protein